MNFELKEFQKDAVADLLEKLQSAKTEVRRTGAEQAIVLSAPTASGKTVIAAALIERILGGDGGIPEDVAFEKESDAVFLWLSDQPELNLQTRDRFLAASSRLRHQDLIILENDFDRETFEGGKVYFLNYQKLSQGSLLTRLGTLRQFTIWDTIRNTQDRFPDKFYVFIDEAHRGMRDEDRAEARTIVQKFLVGSSEDDLPKMNIILGISATPERFDSFLARTERTRRRKDVKPSDVRLSGLIKDKIVLHPEGAEARPWSLLEDACREFVTMASAWSAYTTENGMPHVNPAMIIQVEPGSEGALSRTPLNQVISTLALAIPDLREEHVVHCFDKKERLNLRVDNHSFRIRYAEPSSIAADQTIRVVIFKDRLTTGWDCPRAEVMFSFRRAEDPTYIAQLMGRMVRTPLAQRIYGNERLNNVYLYLPYYNENNVEKIVKHLTGDPETVPPSVVTVSSRSVELAVAPELIEIPSRLRGLPTYVVQGGPPQTPLRRLMRLARRLVHDDIDEGIQSIVLEKLVDVMAAHVHARQKSDPAFEARLASLQKVSFKTVMITAGDYVVEPGEPKTIDVSPRDVDALFGRAKSVLTDELAVAYWRRRHDPEEPVRAKLELIELASDENLLSKLKKAASDEFERLWEKHEATIAQLSSEAYEAYRQIKAADRQAQLVGLNLPTAITSEINDGATNLAGHLYRDAAGLFPAVLNGWEEKVLATELARPDFVTWIRNMSRKPWALAYTYDMRGIKLGYPDFLVVRREGEDLRVDILEPHRSEEDSVAKARGLAQFASAHGAKFGRIEMIRINGRVLKRLSLKRTSIQEFVIKTLQTGEQLTSLFETEAEIEHSPELV